MFVAQNASATLFIIKKKKTKVPFQPWFTRRYQCLHRVRAIRARYIENEVRNFKVSYTVVTNTTFRVL